MPALVFKLAFGCRRYITGHDNVNFYIKASNGSLLDFIHSFRSKNYLPYLSSPFLSLCLCQCWFCSILLCCLFPSQHRLHPFVFIHLISFMLLCPDFLSSIHSFSFCLSVIIPVSLSFFLSLRYLSFSLSICIFLSICISICLSLHMRLLICLSVFKWVCLPSIYVSLSFSLSLCLSFCLSV
jgi:hypothetical protein